MDYELERQKKIADYVLGKDVLDIGYAAMPNPFLNKYSTTGYDMNNPSTLSNYQFEVFGDVDKITEKLNKNSFDTIVCGELIEHLEDPYRFLRDIRPLLKGPKRLILSTPNPLSPFIIFFEYLMVKKYCFIPDHKYYFLPRWMVRIIENSGYTVDKIIPIGIPLSKIIIPTPTCCSYQLIYIAHSKD